MDLDADVEAWATLALAAFAVATAIFAYLAWRAQTAEIITLQEQLDDQRRMNEKQLPVLEGQRDELEAAREQRRRDQFERAEAFVRQVFIWHEFDDRGSPAVSTVSVRNAAGVPVYDVGISWRTNGALSSWASDPQPLMPSEEAAISSTFRTWAVPSGIGEEAIEVRVYIRDAADQCWEILLGGRYAPFEDEMLPEGRWKRT